MLALQGAFARHVEALARCGADAFEVRTADELARCDALVMPGGESTTMIKLLVAFELEEPLRRMLADGLPVFGTCAGMILLAHDVSDGVSATGRPLDRLCFDAIDLDVRRNGYGRQIDSFEADLMIPTLDQFSDEAAAFTAVFIRAPVVERVGERVEVLAEHERVPVLCRQDHVMVSSFHPELTGDDRLHQYFLTKLVGA